MSITRNAILISSPVSTGTDLGTNKDVELWKKFLTSANGGCWNPETEIKTFFSPTSQAVIDYIRNLKAANPDLGYVFFAYSGHGQNGTSGDIIYPFTNLTDFLPVSNIKQEIEKLEMPATIIIDACRLSSIPSSTASNNQQGANTLPKSNFNFRQPGAGTRETHAFKWNGSNHSISDEKVVLIQSCEAHKEARMAIYSDIKCSLFTSELIKVGLAATKSMSIQEAFLLARDNTQSISTSWDPARVQIPQISDGTITHAFCLGQAEITETEFFQQRFYQNHLKHSH